MSKIAKTLFVTLASLTLGASLWAADPVTLTVEVYDRAAPGYLADNNFMTKWIQDQVKKELNIDVKFVTVPRFQEDKVNLMMAAGQAPDISLMYDVSTVTNFIKNGGLTDLTKLIPQYAPNLQKYLGQEVLGYGQWNGKQWAIPAKRVFTGTFSGFIRQDWLDILKLPVPKTTQEFYNVLKAFKEKDPGKTGGKVIPFGITVDPKNIDWTSSLIMESFKDPKTPDEDKVTMERWTLPGYKEGVRFLNKLYNEGLMSPNFVLDKDGQQYVKDLVQGNVGAIIHNFDNPYRATPGMATELMKNVPTAKLVPFEAFANSAGKNQKFKYNPNGLFIFIPKFSKNAEAALKYLNWMSKPETLFFLQNGNMGDQYLKVRNGIPTDFVPNDKLPDEKKYNSSGDLNPLVNGKEFGDQDKNLDALSFGYPGFENEVKAAMKISMKDAAPAFRFDEIIKSESELRATLDTMGAEIWVKSITAKPADFNATYDSLVKEYMAAGGTKVVTEKRKAYEAQIAAAKQ